MKRLNIVLTIWTAAFLALVAGCGQKAPLPQKEGVVWKVVWSEKPNLEHGLYRGKMTEKLPPGQGGEYGVEMRGALYPNYLELWRANSKDAHSIIIPLHQIIWLEFGESETPF